MALQTRTSISIGKDTRSNAGTTGLRLPVDRQRRHTAASAITQRELQQHWKRLQKLDEMRVNRQTVEEYDRLIERITGVHKHCDEAVDWAHIHALPAPFTPPDIGPKQQHARQKLDNFSPRWYERLFAALGRKRKLRLEAAVRQAGEADARDYEDWRSLNQLAERVLRRDADAYLQALEIMKPFDDLLALGSDFEVGADDGDALEVEFRVKAEAVVPDYALSLTPTGKLSRKALTKTRYYELVQDCVSSCAIRIARDLMALLPVQRAAVHAVDRVVNTATGHPEDVTVLSVVFDRPQLSVLNFDRIDPSDALEKFPHQMDFARTSGFKPVSRIVL